MCFCLHIAFFQHLLSEPECEVLPGHQGGIRSFRRNSQAYQRRWRQHGRAGLHQLCGQVQRCEGLADTLHQQGLSLPRHCQRLEDIFIEWWQEWNIFRTVPYRYGGTYGPVLRIHTGIILKRIRNLKNFVTDPDPGRILIRIQAKTVRIRIKTKK